MKKLTINNTKPLKETKREELIHLRAENEYMKAEVAVKKEIVLREEKQAELLKAKKRQSPKSSWGKGAV